jgi:hypothetical protein
MPKKPLPLPSDNPAPVPRTPSPSAMTASEGIETTRALARRYLPDAVQLLAGIAFGRDTEAALHTRMLCAKEIVAMAGVIPQPTPTPPPPPSYERDGDAREPG